MHAIRWRSKVRRVARDRVGIYLRLICSVGLRFKHCNVRVPYQQGEGAMQWAKLLHLVRAPSSGRMLVLQDRTGQTKDNVDPEYSNCC